MLADLRDTIAERRAGLRGMDQAAFDAEAFTPAGPDSYGRFMRIRVMDMWMHEQDVRAVVGRPGHEEGLAPQAALDEMTGALGFVVGKRAGAPSGSHVRFELTGPMTRRIDVEVGSAPGWSTTWTATPPSPSGCRASCSPACAGAVGQTGQGWR